MKRQKQTSSVSSILCLKSSAIVFFALLCSTVGVAQSEPENLSVYEEQIIIGTPEERTQLSGSAYLLDTETLESYDYTDLNRVLSQVPGIYIRTEDGFGLRPNIGIRGATSDRSQKVTLMEDRILIAPAPYSAPAAYYIPNVNRMASVEVVKGPATTSYGPHTVGGAINFVTPTTPLEREAEIDLTLGSYGFQKQRAFYGDQTGSIGYWIEGLRYASDGFKELDGGGDTGFVRNDANAKLIWRGQGERNPSLELKLGYADEDADETYLGLTDADFESDPNRRYAASQLDNFTSEHQQAHLIYSIDVASDLSLSARTYVHRFDRTWLRFSGFIGGESTTGLELGVSTDDILSQPDIFTRELAILRGELDSADISAETLHLANNQRSYGSEGVQVDLNYQLQMAQIDHEFDLGLRYHRDYVDRLHGQFGYLMQAGELVSDGDTYAPTTDNRAETSAFALNLSDRILVDDWQITLGARLEKIDAELINHLDSGVVTDRKDSVVTPSLGVTYGLTEAWTLIAGLYKGFSPTGAAASDEVDPEESTNIEYGFRYARNGLAVDLIGFSSDYDNLIGRCRASDVGCEVGEEFNGGQVEIVGLELLANYSVQMLSFELPLSLSYTRTDTAFQQRFESGFSQWGTVQSGDELPYVPTDVARLETGLLSDDWALNLSATYSGEMREVPGQGAIKTDELIESFWTIDATARYKWNENLSLMLALDNLLNAQEISSRRPFGARPTKPRTVNATVSYRF